jgi:hypothetical protein
MLMARCLLCLACGHVSVGYLRAGSRLFELPVEGDVWTPPCPAVARLRDALFHPYWRNRSDVEVD